MSGKFVIERNSETGRFDLLMLCNDGIYDVLSDHATRAEALAAKRHTIAEAAACDAADRHYQAQYVYACGYHD